jgi:hypothetical protein
MKIGKLLAFLFLFLVSPLMAQTEISDPGFIVSDLDTNPLGARLRGQV